MMKVILGALVFGLLSLNASGVYAKLSKDELKAARQNIDDGYKNDRDKCKTLARNAKDICMAEARGNRSVAKAELNAKDKGTRKARQDAREARAKADFEVARQKCDEKGGNTKKVCLKEARAARTAAMADA
jgi:hypothetical protein